jgi:hypothetical protein
MKKAFLDQLFLGFLLLTGIVTFVATVADEAATRNTIYDLKALAVSSSQSIARYYEQNMNMCNGIGITEDILNESKLGKELLELKASGDISFTYAFYDKLPAATNNTPAGDGQPDSVVTTISGYKKSTFWYRFFGKDSFTLGTISSEEPVNTPRDVTVRYGARPSAGYQNIMGTYELDNNNCITNMRMHMANSKDWNKWEELTNPSDSNSPKIPIVDGITSPPTFVFSIANGNRQFNSPHDNANIDLEQPHCFDDATYPRLTINNITKQATVGDNNSANVFFEHGELNADGIEHFHIIPVSILSDYLNYKNNLYTANGNERDKYEAFKQYADALNEDADPNNDINYDTDPNDEYNYALEDLDASASDFDFSDMILDSTRIVKENDQDDYTVDANHKINFNSGYCESSLNIPPILQLTGCPMTVAEDGTSSSINWTATDTDGTIVRKDAVTNHGVAIVKPNGTIEYTPDSDYYGNDTITVVVTDNNDAIARRDCQVVVTNVNDAPTINGTPLITVNINQTYIFTPTANDIDGDFLTFGISNKPSWANFDSSTGELSGIPQDSDEGEYSNIIISVLDGHGGSASLSAFTIQVIGINNNAPTLVTIINYHDAIENNTYTYNLVPHFEDTDGDTLTYTVTVNIGGNSTTYIAPNGILSINIPDGLAGTTANIQVEVSDGKESVTHGYLLTISSNSDCNSSFESTFTGSTNNWVGGKLADNGKNYLIDGGSSAIVHHFFGQGCRKINIRITFKYKTNSNWEDSDYVDLYINGIFIASYPKTNTNWIEKSKVFQTDDNGWLTIVFFNLNKNSNKRVRIDNVKAELE